MNLRNRWLIAVLICGVQLIAALWMVSHQLQRFEDRTIGFMSKQSLDNSNQIAQDLIRQSTLSLGKDGDSFRSDLFFNLIEKTESARNHDFFLGDMQTGDLVQWDPFESSPPPIPLDTLMFRKLDSPQPTSVAGLLKQLPLKPLSGEITIDTTPYFASLHSIPNSAQVLIVGESRPELLSEFAVWMASTRRVCFTGALLLGFATIFLTTSTMQKFEVQLSKFHQRLQNMVELRTAELSKTKNGVIFGLAKLAESRDNDTGEHLDRIRAYVMILSAELRKTHREIDDEFIQNLALASSLHDIGKVGIPDAVLLKPGRLSDLERKIMQYHTTIGHECLEAIEDRIGTDGFLRMACEIARSHHERWDGKGYPDGISGNAIPLSARIVSVADVYDALTSRRPYKEPMSHEKSCEIIFSGTGTQFDPEVVAAFQRRQGEFRFVMNSCQKESGDVALTPAIAKLHQALNEVPEDEVLV